VLGSRVEASFDCAVGAALALLEQAGDIDVLVANAALPASGLLESFSQDEIERALRVNLESPVRMTRELLPRREKRGSGHFCLRLLDLGFRLYPTCVPVGGRSDCLGPDRKTVARSHGSLRSDYRPTLSVHRLDVLTD